MKDKFVIVVVVILLKTVNCASTEYSYLASNVSNSLHEKILRTVNETVDQSSNKTYSLITSLNDDHNKTDHPLTTENYNGKFQNKSSDLSRSNQTQLDQIMEQKYYSAEYITKFKKTEFRNTAIAETDSLNRMEEKNRNTTEYYVNGNRIKKMQNETLLTTLVNEYKEVKKDSQIPYTNISLTSTVRFQYAENGSFEKNYDANSETFIETTKTYYMPQMKYIDHITTLQPTYVEGQANWIHTVNNSIWFDAVAIEKSSKTFALETTSDSNLSKTTDSNNDIDITSEILETLKEELQENIKKENQTDKNTKSDIIKDTNISKFSNTTTEAVITNKVDKSYNYTITSTIPSVATETTTEKYYSSTYSNLNLINIPVALKTAEISKLIDNLLNDQLQIDSSSGNHNDLSSKLYNNKSEGLTEQALTPNGISDNIINVLTTDVSTLHIPVTNLTSRAPTADEITKSLKLQKSIPIQLDMHPFTINNIILHKTTESNYIRPPKNNTTEKNKKNVQPTTEYVNDKLMKFNSDLDTNEKYNLLPNSSMEYNENQLYYNLTEENYINTKKYTDLYVEKNTLKRQTLSPLFGDNFVVSTPSGPENKSEDFLLEGSTVFDTEFRNKVTALKNDPINVEHVLKQIKSENEMGESSIGEINELNKIEDKRATLKTNTTTNSLINNVLESKAYLMNQSSHNNNHINYLNIPNYTKRTINDFSTLPIKFTNNTNEVVTMANTILNEEKTAITANYIDKFTSSFMMSNSTINENSISNILLGNKTYKTMLNNIENEPKIHKTTEITETLEHNRTKPTNFEKAIHNKSYTRTLINSFQTTLKDTRVVNSVVNENKMGPFSDSQQFSPKGFSYLPTESNENNNVHLTTSYLVLPNVKKPETTESFVSEFTSTTLNIPIETLTTNSPFSLPLPLRNIITTRIIQFNKLENLSTYYTKSKTDPIAISEQTPNTMFEENNQTSTSNNNITHNIFITNSTTLKQHNDMKDTTKTIFLYINGTQTYKNKTTNSSIPKKADKKSTSTNVNLQFSSDSTILLPNRKQTTGENYTDTVNLNSIVNNNSNESETKNPKKVELFHPLSEHIEKENKSNITKTPLVTLHQPFRLSMHNYSERINYIHDINDTKNTTIKLLKTSNNSRLPTITINNNDVRITPKAAKKFYRLSNKTNVSTTKQIVYNTYRDTPGDTVELATKLPLIFVTKLTPVNSLIKPILKPGTHKPPKIKHDVSKLRQDVINGNVSCESLLHKTLKIKKTLNKVKTILCYCQNTTNLHCADIDDDKQPKNIIPINLNISRTEKPKKHILKRLNKTKIYKQRKPNEDFKIIHLKQDQNTNNKSVVFVEIDKPKDIVLKKLRTEKLTPLQNMKKSRKTVLRILKIQTPYNKVTKQLKLDMPDKELARKTMNSQTSILKYKLKTKPNKVFTYMGEPYEIETHYNPAYGRGMNFIEESDSKRASIINFNNPTTGKNYEDHRNIMKLLEIRKPVSTTKAPFYRSYYNLGNYYTTELPNIIKPVIPPPDTEGPKPSSKTQYLNKLLISSDEILQEKFQSQNKVRKYSWKDAISDIDQLLQLAKTPIKHKFRNYILKANLVRR